MERSGRMQTLVVWKFTQDGGNRLRGKGNPETIRASSVNLLSILPYLG
jgi:hypothetical protein